MDIEIGDVVKVTGDPAQQEFLVIGKRQDGVLLLLPAAIIKVAHETEVFP